MRAPNWLRRLLRRSVTVEHPPLPPNPYRRFYTKQRSFEELVRTAREREKQQTGAGTEQGPRR